MNRPESRTVRAIEWELESRRRMGLLSAAVAAIPATQLDSELATARSDPNYASLRDDFAHREAVTKVYLLYARGAALPQRTQAGNTHG